VHRGGSYNWLVYLSVNAIRTMVHSPPYATTPSTYNCRNRLKHHRQSQLVMSR
ncbi:hypothetical protein A2U01_0088848, partial [Trifolium medium]|nr:hypothetical protein [Trifolium medium]